MAGLVKKNLDAPEETRPFKDDMGHLAIVNADAGAVGRATFQPGWRWSEHVKPISGTDSCQAAHTGYMISGHGPGDFMVAPPGHDAWVVGDEACVVVDWQGFADYAKTT
jgi:hypothetical protein